MESDWDSGTMTFCTGKPLWPVLPDDITEMLDSKQLFFVVLRLSGKIFLRVIRIPEFL